MGFPRSLQIDKEKLAAAQATPNHVSIDEMPDYLGQAFVSIEDHRFHRHIGIDFISLGRALWIDLVKGGKIQGGSTITMQLARNLFLTNNKTFSRKIKEIWIAFYLEWKFSKPEILEMYLNNIYFGHGIYGIETAASFYFGKTTRMDNPNKEIVSLAEAAMLAALPKAPERYSPVKDFSKAKRRQEIVLKRMLQLGVITKAEQEAAVKEKIHILGKYSSLYPNKQNRLSIHAS
ncbi:transglycosylase domain-containing protein [Thermoflavimicrobium dichotomicum]|uniref:Penicillin-binding protein 1A/penicillin-binding protein 2A n=1 Tax=Thermoflavimicrobium dichotomicum TaxID=46223 RepID=A0A1I3MNC4_9BACL|nr:transglycosylase domain-containing protein [Thermoflavimicrobium dichotomicum]SFI98483.1 penicillin-binding protein 1A/penicillin-binding protein 2A [Thermoflavimicrobium dichotomicum]